MSQTPDTLHAKDLLPQPDESGIEVSPYAGPAGGWGALASTARSMQRAGLARSAITLKDANQAEGFDCPGCAWPDAPEGKLVDFCENGVKAVTAEATPLRLEASFFAQHSLAELRQWTDHQLEAQGRLTQPLRHDAVTGHYQPVSWEEALAGIAAELRALDPMQVAFYCSGRSSNEAAFLWQLLARQFGSPHLPDSSNLCHEPSGMGLKAAIGVGKGTAQLADFEVADAIWVWGQNPGTNHPRMLGVLHEARRRGADIVAINPLKERGLERFADPQSPRDMLGGGGLPMAQVHVPVQIGGDLALIKGLMRCLVSWHETPGHPLHGQALDEAFIAQHTLGYEALRDDLLQEDWALIEQESGLARAEIEALAERYARAGRVLHTWCMGITHHEQAVATVHSLANLALLRGQVGQPGAGLVPVRGHSNVQGDRTQGITSQPPATWLQRLREVCHIEPPTTPGLDAYGVVQGLCAPAPTVRALLSLGGNFGVAAPDALRLLPALSRSRLTVHIATKLNRTHIFPGQAGYVLPCLGRTEADWSVPDHQGQRHLRMVSVEDSMSMVHRSQGRQPPASPLLRSEPDIIAALGAALFPSGAAASQDGHPDAPLPVTPQGPAWPGISQDYARLRDLIEACQDGVFEGFHRFNERLAQPKGFWLPNPAARREWKTASGKAHFHVQAIPTGTAWHQAQARARQEGSRPVLKLMSLRSHDQYNTTVYGLDDRYRGVRGGRRVLFIHPQDAQAQGFAIGDRVDVVSLYGDGQRRQVHDFLLVAFEIPRGCVAGYFPELTPLVAAEARAQGANTPASKAVPIQLLASTAGHDRA